MHCKTSNRTQHTGGHSRLAAGQAAPRHHGQAQAATAGAARAAPFAAQWPYRSFLELGALAGAVPCARLHARLVLLEWGLAALSESLELVVSELVTNGVRASRAMGGTPFGYGWSPTWAGLWSSSGTPARGLLRRPRTP